MLWISLLLSVGFGCFTTTTPGPNETAVYNTFEKYCQICTDITGGYDCIDIDLMDSSWQDELDASNIYYKLGMYVHWDVTVPRYDELNHKANLTYIYLELAESKPFVVYSMDKPEVSTNVQFQKYSYNAYTLFRGSLYLNHTMTSHLDGRLHDLRFQFRIGRNYEETIFRSVGIVVVVEYCLRDELRIASPGSYSNWPCNTTGNLVVGSSILRYCDVDGWNDERSQFYCDEEVDFTIATTTVTTTNNDLFIAYFILSVSAAILVATFMFFMYRSNQRWLGEDSESETIEMQKYRRKKRERGQSGTYEEGEITETGEVTEFDESEGNPTQVANPADLATVKLKMMTQGIVLAEGGKDKIDIVSGEKIDIIGQKIEDLDSEEGEVYTPQLRPSVQMDAVVSPINLDPDHTSPSQNDKRGAKRELTIPKRKPCQAQGQRISMSLSIPVQNPNDSHRSSVVRELATLALLHNNGDITTEEYAQSKKIVLYE